MPCGNKIVEQTTKYLITFIILKASESIQHKVVICPSQWFWKKVHVHHFLWASDTDGCLLAKEPLLWGRSNEIWGYLYGKLGMLVAAGWTSPSHLKPSTSKLSPRWKSLSSSQQHLLCKPLKEIRKSPARFILKWRKVKKVIILKPFQSFLKPVIQGLSQVMAGNHPDSENVVRIPTWWCQVAFMVNWVCFLKTPLERHDVSVVGGSRLKRVYLSKPENDKKSRWCLMKFFVSLWKKLNAILFSF